MILVRTQIGLSEVHGIGLFAAEFILKGTITWRYEPDFDAAYSEGALLRMSEAAKEQFLKYAYYDKELERYILCSDDQRFINHESNHPNIISTPRQDIAARDILPGEELLCDYNCYDDTYFVRVGMPHLCNTAFSFSTMPHPAPICADSRVSA